MGSASSLQSSRQGSASVVQSAHPLYAHFKHVGLVASNLSSDLEVTKVLEDGQWSWLITQDANVWNMSEHLKLFADSVDAWPIEGRLSPPSSLDALSDAERSNALAPSTATTFSWAHSTAIEFKTDAKQDLEVLMASSDPNLGFFLRGGFVFLDSNNLVCKVNIIVPSEDSGLQFGSPQKWNPDWTLPLQARFKQITIKALHDVGARYYCWIGPNEPLLRVFEGPKLARGGFVYLFHDEILFDPSEDEGSLDCVIPLTSVLPTKSDKGSNFSYVSDTWRQYSKVTDAMETPYGILAKHFREEHKLGNLSEAKYLLLTKALKDLTSSRRESVLNIGDLARSDSWEASEALKDTDTLVKHWLPQFGIKTTRSETPAPSLHRTASILAVCITPKESLLEQMPNLSNLKLDAFATSNSDIVTMMALGLQVPRDLLGSFSIEQECLTRWIVAMADQYKPNPYHRWEHAWDTFQMAYILLTEGQAAELFLTDLDILSVLIAAIGHDAGHPGVTNVFLSRTSADVAITYNDSSILENMHASILFKTLLQGDGLNFMDKLERSDYEMFRKRTIASILATDMSHHFQMVETLQTKFSTAKTDKGDIASPEADEHKLEPQAVLNAILHFADISGCVRPPNVFLERTALVEAEFFAQGDQERSLGLPISPMMDRHGDPLIKSQGGFVNFVVAPLLYGMQEVVPGLSDQLVVCLQETKTALVEAAKETELRE